jgi:hypothetical protein
LEGNDLTVYKARRESLEVILIQYFQTVGRSEFAMIVGIADMYCVKYMCKAHFIVRYQFIMISVALASN